MNKWQRKYIKGTLPDGDYRVIVDGQEVIRTLETLGNNVKWWKFGKPSYVIAPVKYEPINWWKIIFFVFLILSFLPMVFFDGTDELDCLYFRVFDKLYIFGVLE